MIATLKRDLLTSNCDTVLNLNDAVLPDEYFYTNVPLCVIDFFDWCKILGCPKYS